MPAYYFIYLTLLLGSSFLLLRYFIRRKKSLAMLLFIDATRSENKGNYQEAVIAYNNALCEVNKSKFQGGLKIAIVKRLKVLQTVRAYDSAQAFVRKNNSWIN